MPIQVSEDRTDAYIGTFHYDDASDMLQLQEVRKMVSNMNKMLKQDGFNYKYRVSVKGRLPFRTEKVWVRLADAEFVDVYIHRRKD